MSKSLNKKYKESNINMTFKDFAILENSRVNFMENQERAKSYYNYMVNVNGDVPSGYDLKEDKTKVFGINKTVLVVSGLLVFGSLGVYFYRRLNK